MNGSNGQSKFLEVFCGFQLSVCVCCPSNALRLIGAKHLMGIDTDHASTVCHIINTARTLHVSFTNPMGKHMRRHQNQSITGVPYELMYYHL